jgi:sugar lactone lactonase YvrE
MTTTPDRLAAELVLDAHARLGEGPFWDAATSRLGWVDILQSAVHRFDPVTGEDLAVDVGQHVGAAVPRAGGGLVLAVAGGFALLDDGGTVTPLADLTKPGMRMNDGKVDPRGRFIAGSMAYDESPGAGSLYRLDPDRSVHVLVEGVTVSNGLAWTADGGTLYYVDTPTRGVDAFDYDLDSGAVANRRRAFTIPEEHGFPDGMTIDDEGHLWVAFWGGWAVRRYAADGTPLAVVELPVSQVTSCAFGGADGGDLYITCATPTEADGAGDTPQPHAGGLFRCRPGVTGPAATPAAI